MGLEIGFVDSCRNGTQPRTFQRTLMGKCQCAFLFDGKTPKASVIRSCRVQAFEQWRCEPHADNQRIRLACPQGWQQGVVRLGAELAGDFQLIANRVRHGDGKAGEGTGTVTIAEGRKIFVRQQADGAEIRQIRWLCQRVHMPESWHGIRRTGLLGLHRGHRHRQEQRQDEP